jgi:hypothetical protein
MDLMVIWVLFLGCSKVCLFQGSEHLYLCRKYSLASRVPSHEMVTGLPQVITEPGSAERVSLGRVLAGKQVRRRQVCSKQGTGNVALTDDIKAEPQIAEVQRTHMKTCLSSGPCFFHFHCPLSFYIIGYPVSHTLSMGLGS